MKRKFVIYVSVLFFALFIVGKAFSTRRTVMQQIPFSFIGKVTAIKDGDTYKVLYEGKEVSIRLAHIDCPEKKQPFGKRAKQFSSDICFGKVVTIKTKGKTDRNSRIIGEIILKDGTNVNKALVRNGLAWHFKKYSADKEYAQLELLARKKQVGLWQDKKPIAPWEWRKR